MLLTNVNVVHINVIELIFKFLSVNAALLQEYEYTFGFVQYV